MNPTIIDTSALPHPQFVYSQATKIGNLIFVSGQTGVDFTTGKVTDDFETQARQAFENVSMVLKAAGSSLSKVAKTTVWLCNAANFDKLNELYKEYFPINPPARSTPVVGLPKKNLQISIEVIAYID
jgi:2-iminobutanoate/2-iminopropanoate deaminase